MGVFGMAEVHYAHYQTPIPYGRAVRQRVRYLAITLHHRQVSSGCLRKLFEALKRMAQRYEELEFRLLLMEMLI